MASVYRCLYPFILYKGSDELFIQMLSLFSVFRLEFQQIFKRTSSYGRHLGKSQSTHTHFIQSAVLNERGEKCWAAWRSSRNNMASLLLRGAGEITFLKSLVPCVNLIPVRYRVGIRKPTRKRINPFVQRRTDLIKKLVVALVQHERIQTTDNKAQQLKRYGDLVRGNIII